MPLSGSVSPILDYAEPQPPRSAMARFFTSPWLLLPLILLGGFALRWYQLDHESLWLDEFLAVQNSSGRGELHMSFPRDVIIDPAPNLTQLDEGAPGFGKIWTSLGTDSHPPLYFMTLNFWRHVFGASDLAARGLSLAFSLAAIVLLFDVARLLHGGTVALWAALLMALAGAQIQYAQEARNYTMLLALTLGACDALVRIERLGVNRRRTIALGALALAMMLTHYLALPAVLAIGVYGIVRLRGPALRNALVALGAAGAAFAISWGPFLLEQRGGFANEISAALEGEEQNLQNSFRRLALLPLRYFTEPMKNSRAIGQVAIVMYVIPLLLVWRRRDLLLWCLLGGFTIFFVFASDLYRSAHGLAYARYTLVASAAVYALAAAMLWHMKGIFRHLVPLVLAVSCIAAIEEAYSTTKADARELARYLAARCEPDDVLVIHTLGPDDWQAHALYLALSHYATPRCPIVFISDPPIGALAQRIAQAREIWIMSPGVEIPIKTFFPGAESVEASFFPWVGTVEKVAWD